MNRAQRFFSIASLTSAGFVVMPSAEALGPPIGTPVVISNNVTDPIPIRLSYPISVNNPISFLVPFDTNTVPVKIHLPKPAVLEAFSFACAAANGIVRGVEYEFSLAVDQEGSFALPAGVTVNPSPAAQGTSLTWPMSWITGPTGYFVKSAPLTQTGMGLPVTSDVTLSMVSIDARGRVTDFALAACTGHLVFHFMN